MSPFPSFKAHFIFYFSLIHVPVTFAHKISDNNLAVDYTLMAEILATFLI